MSELFTQAAEESDLAATLLPFSLPLELAVRDPDLVAELLLHEEGQAREEYALCALRIGLLALKQARGQLDAETVRREGERLLGTLEARLTQHSQGVHTFLTTSLKEYFDPESGRFQERVQRLIKKDGELEELLRRQIGGADSELCKTLAVHVGAQSPLFKLLDPKESEGLLKAISDTLSESLTKQRDRVLTEFSLDNKDGALSRLVQELSSNQGQLTEKLQGKIEEVVKEFSLDTEDSALSRLVRKVEQAQRTISSEFSLDNEHSALSRMSKCLESTSKAIDSQLTLDQETSALARLRRELLEILDKHTETSAKFQEEVKVALKEITARRQEARRSTRHGTEFQDLVYEFINNESQKAGDVATLTADTVGAIKNCKVGDAVVELGPDKSAAGARITVEAKGEKGFNLARALEESEMARKNRNAEIGLFVYSKPAAPEGLAPLSHYGSDVVVVWDAEDLQSDLYLKAGLMIAKALCTRQAKQRQAQAADFIAINEAILEIEKKSNGLDDIRTWVETIQSNSEKILDRIRIARKALEKQVEILRDKVADLENLGATRSSAD